MSDVPIHFCHGGVFVIVGCAGCRRAEAKARRATQDTTVITAKLLPGETNEQWLDRVKATVKKDQH